MSTTPSTSDLPYTIVGGSRVQQSGPGVRGLSLLILDRGSRTMRAEIFSRLDGAGFDEVIAVVGPAPHYDVEQMAARYSGCRFVLLASDKTPGEQVNIGMHEATHPLVLVMWSDQEAQRISDGMLQRMEEGKSVCSVPSIRGDRGSFIPSVTAPAFHGNLFRTVPGQPGKHVTRSLYPFDFVALYQREAFRNLGGYDPRITNPYWQKLDFGLRVYLWGDQISVAPDMRVDAGRPIPQENTTPDESYSRFHLKNLAVRFAGDSARLPTRRLLAFALRSGLGPVKAFSVFREIQAWVRRNRYRFVQDARRVTELWEGAE
jgi:hypothetical protein